MSRVQAISWRVAFGLLLSTGLVLAAPAVRDHAAHAQPAAEAAQAQLRALEARRIAAIAARDAAGLQGTLAADYIHVHATGKVDNGPDFVKNTVANARITSRGPLTIRVYGDTAVMTGAQINQQPAVVNGQTPAPALLVVTQVAHRDAGGWRYVSFQATPVRVASQNA